MDVVPRRASRGTTLCCPGLLSPARCPGTLPCPRRPQGGAIVPAKPRGPRRRARSAQPRGPRPLPPPPRRPVPQPAPAPPGRHRPAGSRGGLPQRSARARPFFNFYYRCILNPPRFRLAESSQLKAPEPRPPEPGAAPLPAAVGEHRPPSTRAASPRYVITVPCTPVSARQPDVRSSESRLKAGFSKRKGSTQQQLSPFPGN